MSNQRDDVDLGSLIGAVAIEILGEPNRALSSQYELRWGTHGSTSVDLRKGTFYDHEAKIGGGLLLFMEHCGGITPANVQFEWLESHGHKPKANGRYTNGNGKDHHHKEPTKTSKVAETYDYVNASGEFLFEAVRYDPKGFSQRRRGPNGEWINNLPGVTPVLYRLPELIEALASEKLVFVVEGEKDADNLWKLGIPATTNPMGAGKWRADYNELFKDADVVVIADNDPQSTNKKTGELLFHKDGRPRYPGQDHAHYVAKELSDTADRVRLLDLDKAWPGCPDKGDISDWLDAGGTPERLFEIVSGLSEWTPEQAKSEVPLSSFSAADFDGQTVKDRRWVAHNRVPVRNVTLLGGDGAVGKTTVALQLAVAVGVAHINDWLQSVIIESGPVLFVTAEEERDEVHFRLNQIREHYSLSWADLIDLHIYAAPEEDCLLAVPDKKQVMVATKRYDQLCATVEQIKPKLVILESAADLFGGDEIDRAQVRKFIALLRRIAIKYDCAVVLLYPERVWLEERVRHIRQHGVE